MVHATYLADLGHDMHYALRMIRRHPRFAIIVALILGIGIGATTVVWSAVESTLLTRLPVPGADHLTIMRELWKDGVESGTEMGQPTYPYEHYKDVASIAAPVLVDVAGYAYQQVSLRQGNLETPVSAVLCSPNYFKTLRLVPAVGRFFAPDEPTLPVVVLSFDLWARGFGSDSSVIGRAVSINGRALTVIGVAPPTFRGTLVGFPPDLWLPLEAMRAPQSATDAPRYGYADVRVSMLGRLRQGVAVDQAEAFLNVASSRLPVEHQLQMRQWVRAFRLESLSGLPIGSRGPITAFMSLLILAALAVLGVAISNVGSLLLARAHSRYREIAVRQALGAARGRILRQLFLEGLVLAAVGALLAIAIARFGTAIIRTILLTLPARIDVDMGLTPRTLSVLALTTFTAGLLSMLVPALTHAKADLSASFRGDAVGTPAHRFRWREMFIISQLSLALALLTTATLFGTALRRALSTDLGIDITGRYSATIDLTPYGLDGRTGRAFFLDLVARLRARPDIVNAAVGRFTPLSGNYTIDREAGAIVNGHTAPLHDLPYGIVDAQYLSTFGIPIREGRGFGSDDWDGGSFTIIINQTLARRVWPGQSAIGQRLIIAGIPRTVIGVARDTKYATLDEPQSSYAFLPVAQAYMPMMNIYVHPRNTGVNVDLIVREEASRVNPSIVVQTPVAFDRKVSLQLLPQRLAASFIGTLGAVGLLLGCVGLYALVAQQVALRTREFGIRLALGAPPRSILALVLRRTAIVVGTGVAIGVLLSLAVGQLSRGLLLGVSPSEPVNVALPALMMAAVCVVASYVPARRAIRLDPVRSLQET